MFGKDTSPSPGGEHLPAELREAFVGRARSLRARPRQILISAGDRTADVYVIFSGHVRISLVSGGGRELVLRELGPGAMFGELSALDGLPRSADVTALEDTRLACLTPDEFLAFLGEVPRAGLWLAQQLAATIRSLTGSNSELATQPVAARVHAELLRRAAEAASSDSVVIAMPTHADIAARIGTHREAVTRELNLLAREGLVRQTGRRAEITSVARLKALLDRVGRL